MKWDRTWSQFISNCLVFCRAVPVPYYFFSRPKVTLQYRVFAEQSLILTFNLDRSELKTSNKTVINTTTTIANSVRFVSWSSLHVRKCQAHIGKEWLHLDDSIQDRIREKPWNEVALFPLRTKPFLIESNELWPIIANVCFSANHEQTVQNLKPIARDLPCVHFPALRRSHEFWMAPSVIYVCCDWFNVTICWFWLYGIDLKTL